MGKGAELRAMAENFVQRINVASLGCVEVDDDVLEEVFSTNRRHRAITETV